MIFHRERLVFPLRHELIISKIRSLFQVESWVISRRRTTTFHELQSENNRRDKNNNFFHGRERNGRRVRKESFFFSRSTGCPETKIWARGRRKMGEINEIDDDVNAVKSYFALPTRTKSSPSLDFGGEYWLKNARGRILAEKCQFFLL